MRAFWIVPASWCLATYSAAAILSSLCLRWLGWSAPGNAPLATRRSRSMKFIIFSIQEGQFMMDLLIPAFHTGRTKMMALDMSCGGLREGVRAAAPQVHSTEMTYSANVVWLS